MQAVQYEGNGNARRYSKSHGTPEFVEGSAGAVRCSKGHLTLEVVAGHDVEKLGIAFSTLPPEPVVVRRVAEGTWAAQKGIQEGHVFEAINNVSVRELTGDDFKTVLRQRPLTMRLAHMFDDESPQSRKTLLDTERDSLLDLVVGSDIQKIGIVFCTVPPEPLVVKRIMEGSWAEAKGIKEGQAFVAINGINIGELNKEEFLRYMQERPLILRMGDAEDDTTSSLESEPNECAIEVAIPDAYKVWLHVYDLRGNENTNDSLIALGFGVFHAGIEVYGVEWSFGYIPTANTTGVYPVPPRRSPLGTHRESVCLGAVRTRSARNSWQLMQSLGAAWLGRDYHLTRRNCHHFCAELSQLLGVSNLPGWVGRLAVAADYTLVPLLEAFSVPVMPVPPPTESLDAPTSVSDTSSGEIVPETNSRSSVVASNSLSSVVASVATHFDRRYGWALTKMLMCESQGERDLLQAMPNENGNVSDSKAPKL